MSAATARQTRSSGPARPKTNAGPVAKRDRGPLAPDDTASDLKTGTEKKQTGWFTCFAQKTAQLAGRPATFILATAVIVIWGITGPIFGYSDTWQLIINTGTTIVTFLMVFLIQHTQNRDSLAFQVKLDELIIAMQGARNKVAAAEDMCDADLEALHATFRERAAETLDTLEQRRATRVDR
jgi:low affinity Fe/Cu permease